MSTQYAHVYIPLQDVYEMSGSDALRRFADDSGGRNLVVLPMKVLRSLSKSHEYGQSGREILKLLGGAERVRDPDDKTSLDRVSAGLDVLRLRSVNGAADLDHSGLVELVQNAIGDDGSSPTFITTDSYQGLELADLGLTVESPRFLQVNEDIVNNGLITGSADLQAALHEASGAIDLAHAQTLVDDQLLPNQFIRFVGKRGYQFGRVVVSEREGIGTVKLLGHSEYRRQLRIGESKLDDILGVEPLDMEQYLALQYGLLDPDISIFFLCGSQGSGKTLLSYVAAVEQVLLHDKEECIRRGYDITDEDSKKIRSRYDQIIVLKPNNTMGGRDREVGYLPGGLLEKIGPVLASFEHAHDESTLSGFMPFEQMFYDPKHKRGGLEMREPRYKNIKPGGAHLPPDREVIRLMHSGFMRGYSLSDSIVIVDEAQNFEPYELKTILERLGPGCKVIVLGDPLQLDNPRCTHQINGLTHAIAHYQDREFSGLIKLTRNYRSDVSEHALTWRTPRPKGY